MFRRKEDSLFDNTTDPNQPEGEGAGQQAHAPAGAYGAPPVPPGSRFASAQPASSFRSGAAPLPADLNRNRMPEAKMANTPSNLPAGVDKSKTRRVLTVGNDILLKGEIATCDRLVIEGKVDATLSDVHTVEIAETGSFKGSAHIEDAEISGLFEGDLIVRGRLVIYGTGKVRGKIAYGEIEIERGGELSGEIKLGGAQSASSASRHSSQPSKPDSKAA